MLDADKLLIKTPEEAKKLDNNKKIIPVTDNLLKYQDIVYELENVDLRLLTDFRITRGYDRYYDGFEKRPGDARDINGMLLSAIWHITNIIDHEQKDKIADGTKHKIVCKLVK